MTIKDLTGRVFGRLRVIEYAETKNNRAYWKCECNCGNTKIAMGKTLVNGGTTSCGCFFKERVRDVHFDDISNIRYGHLVTKTVIFNDGRTYWNCLCDCGRTTIVEATKLKSGHTKSCGCLHAHSAKIRAIERNKKMRGKNHPRWRPDLTDDERLLKKEKRQTDPKLNRWRNKVYNRDEYKCIKCGSNKSGTLNAHHIYSWACYPKLRYITNNGVTLCVECHKKFHNKYGTKKNTKKQLTEWLQ